MVATGPDGTTLVRGNSGRMARVLPRMQGGIVTPDNQFAPVSPKEGRRVIQALPGEDVRLPTINQAVQRPRQGLLPDLGPRFRGLVGAGGPLQKEMIVGGAETPRGVAVASFPAGTQLSPETRVRYGLNTSADFILDPRTGRMEVAASGAVPRDATALAGGQQPVYITYNTPDGNVVTDRRMANAGAIAAALENPAAARAQAEAEAHANFRAQNFMGGGGLRRWGGTTRREMDADVRNQALLNTSLSPENTAQATAEGTEKTEAVKATSALELQQGRQGYIRTEYDKDGNPVLQVDESGKATWKPESGTQLIRDPETGAIVAVQGKDAKAIRQTPETVQARKDRVESEAQSIAERAGIAERVAGDDKTRDLLNRAVGSGDAAKVDAVVAGIQREQSVADAVGGLDEYLAKQAELTKGTHWGEYSGRDSAAKVALDALWDESGIGIPSSFAPHNVKRTPLNEATWKEFVEATGGDADYARMLAKQLKIKVPAEAKRKALQSTDPSQSMMTLDEFKEAFESEMGVPPNKKQIDKARGRDWQ